MRMTRPGTAATKGGARTVAVLGPLKAHHNLERVPVAAPRGVSDGLPRGGAANVLHACPG